MVLVQTIRFLVKFINRLFYVLNLDYRIKFILSDRKRIIIPYDMGRDFVDIFNQTKKYTMTSIERMFSLFLAIEYIVKYNIPGDIVECGVWKGGSMMLTASALLKKKDLERKLYLYDTYEGMSKPTSRDVRSLDNYVAKTKWLELEKSNLKWDNASLEEVKKNLYSTKYPPENLIFAKGNVEETIPKIIPEKISILRLDTDWYESTYHELVHLFPRLVKYGILIIDDYGYWKGSREATEKYFKERNIKIFLNRIDNTGRIAIKL